MTAADLPAPKTADTRWMQHGLCNGVSPDMFFPGRGGDVASAKALCARCPVQTDCLDYALTPPVELWGVWGGKSEKERRRIRWPRHHARRNAAS